ncbi:E3 ubiquitin-protein ligase listerin [Exophiala dermatitidis]
MSKKFKSQASSARAASAVFGSSSFAFGAPTSGGFRSASTSLSYITEQPDLSSVSNPNVVVALRNLGKKDSTTKAKALEELQEHIGASKSADRIDPGLLEAWVNLYPRTSIDNSRRVRQLAHTLQGSLTVISGKRIAPHLPKVIGAWLSGVYDSDKLVARAAQESITAAFTTEDKRRALWKIYRDALVDYAEDAILVQTPNSLSDERSTSPDDAEAKFIRVVGNAIYLLCQVLRTNFSAAPDGGTVEVPEGLKTILTDKKLWGYSYSQDPNLRRAVCTLVVVCTETASTHLDWTAISACFIGKALSSSQIGSARQLSEALLALTLHRPEIWTSDYSSKSPASKRLHQFLNNGSQRGPADFWDTVAALLRRIPLEVWAPDYSDGHIQLSSATALVTSLRAGVTNSDEPRQNLPAAWSAYVDTSFWILSMLADEDSKSTLANEELLPLVAHYITQSTQQVSWKLPPSCDQRISSEILANVLHQGLNRVFETTWSRLCQELADSMKLSLPESSKDFAKSQDAVIAQAQRLFRLRTSVLRSVLDQAERSYAGQVFQLNDEELVNVATELLDARNGKPYSAAFVLERISAQSELPQPKGLHSFLQSDALPLLNSPSAEYVISMILTNGQNVQETVSTLLHSEPSDYCTAALRRLLAQISMEDLTKNSELESFILHEVSTALRKQSVQQMTQAVVRNPNLRSSKLQNRCIQCVIEHLSTDTDAALQRSALNLLLALLTEANTANLLFADPGSDFLSRLLLLTDSQDPEVAELANLLIAKIRKESPVGTSAATSSTKVVQDQLSGSGFPLSIFTLINLAKDTLKSAPPDQSGTIAMLLPSAQQWADALRSHLAGRRPRSLVVTNALHGIVFMIEQGAPQPTPHLRDADEFSLLFRLVFYVTRMASDTDILTLLPSAQLEALYSHYPLALQLVNEKLTVDSANDIWQNTTNEVVEEAADILSQGSSLLQSWLQDESLINTWIDMIRSASDMTPQSFLKGLAFTDIASRYADEFGSGRLLSSFDTEINEMHKASEVIRSASLLCACRDRISSTQQGRKLVNELIAIGTDLRSPESSTGLRSLVLLDLLLDGNSDALSEVPSQRLVFFVQTLSHLITETSDELGYQTQAMRLLDPMLSAARDIYGAHWERIIQCIAAMWHDGNDLTDNVPLLHASLRLYGRLRSLVASEDCNDDLSDAWKAAEVSLEDGLVHCLDIFKGAKEETNQPLQITAELLRRQLSHISPRHHVDLYPFLSSTEPAIRGAAYDLLHRSIPAEQEQRSLDLTLEQKVSHISDDLLSLLSDTPSQLEIGSRPLRQTYLLCWHLVFDHFTTASYKLREVYTSDIQEAHVLPQLLEVVCEMCRITGRPLDGSKVDFETFELGTDDMGEKEEQRLVMHLYYCCLLYLPSLTRGWFLEQKNRVKLPLESWTQKYFSPCLIAAAIRTVTDWVASQSQDDTDASINVKASLGGSEIVASIAIDPESPPISLAVSLPATYPLDSPTVSSRTRVGVSEKNWQSWLRTFQIIIFSTGSIIEGLVAFRRNVQGALKGQKVWDVPQHFPWDMPFQMVQKLQQFELPTLPEQFQLRLKELTGSTGFGNAVVMTGLQPAQVSGVGLVEYICLQKPFSYAEAVF